MRKKLKSIKSLKSKAWKLFSIWIRKSNANFQGYVACITCGKSYRWNSGEIHAGHFFHGRLDFHEMNVHPQCRDCNYDGSGRVSAKYGVVMTIRYGYEAVIELEKESVKKGNDYKRDELMDIIAKYERLNKTL